MVRHASGGGRGRGPSSAVWDLVPLGLIVADGDGAAHHANPAWSELTGQGPLDWRGWGWFEALATRGRAGRREALVAAARAGATYAADWTVQGARRERRVLHVVAVPDLVDGRLARIVVTAADVTEERSRAEGLLDRATHDHLTGLANRARFDELVDRAVDRRRRDPGLVTAVVFVDVDDLKATNDTFGHGAGDRLLRQVGTCLAATVRPADVVARYGGDEFTVLCEDLADEEEATTLAARLGAAVRDGSDGGPPCTVTVGVAVAHDRHLDAAALIGDADEAMYLGRRGRERRAGREGRGSRPRLREPTQVREDHLALLAEAVHDMQIPLTEIRGYAAMLRRPEGDDAWTELARRVERRADDLGHSVTELVDLGRGTPAPAGAADVADPPTATTRTLEAT